MPIEWAVPAIIFLAVSTSVVLRSGSLASATSVNCWSVMVPAVSLGVLDEPFLILIFCFISSDTGGSLVIKVKVRSSKTVISAGITWPFLSLVFSLYWLINSMMLTPCCPRAGPMGGAGFAVPAGRFSLRMVLTFFAIADSITESLNY